MLIGFIAETIWHRLKYFRYICSFVILFITTLLFMARFPFYQQFHSGFNQMLFTAMHEDLYALFISLVEEFQLPLKLLLIIALVSILNYAFNKFLVYSFKVKRWQILPEKIKTVSLLMCIYVLGTLSLYGGGWSWKSGVNWENAGITNDTFLNESIFR